MSRGALNSFWYTAGSRGYRFMFAIGKLRRGSFKWRFGFLCATSKLNVCVEIFFHHILRYKKKTISAVKMTSLQ